MRWLSGGHDLSSNHAFHDHEAEDVALLYNAYTVSYRPSPPVILSYVLSNPPYYAQFVLLSYAYGSGSPEYVSSCKIDDVAQLETWCHVLHEYFYGVGSLGEPHRGLSEQKNSYILMEITAWTPDAYDAYTA